MKIIASYNVKGGVGKTSTAVNLAFLAAAEGRRTLIWDLDPQAAATFLFRVRPKVKGGSDKLVKGRRRIADSVKGTDFADLDLLPADFTYRNMDIDLVDRPRPTQTMRRLLAPLAKEYDLVILDTPPSLSLVSENVLHAADLVLVPIIPTVLSVRTFDQLTQFVKEFKGRQAEAARVLLDGRPTACIASRDRRIPADRAEERHRHGHPRGVRRGADGGAPRACRRVRTAEPRGDRL